MKNCYLMRVLSSMKTAFSFCRGQSVSFFAFVCGLEKTIFWNFYHDEVTFLKSGCEVKLTSWKSGCEVKLTSWMCDDEGILIYFYVEMQLTWV